MGKKGQTTVEFALAALAFFAFLFALLDVGVMFYVYVTMQNAVREGVRHAITRQENPEQLRGALENAIKEASGGIYDKTAKPDIVVKVRDANNFANYTGSKVDDTGQPGQIIMVTVNYAWPLMTPFLKPLFKDGAYSFSVRATMRNEPSLSDR